MCDLVNCEFYECQTYNTGLEMLVASL